MRFQHDFSLHRLRNNSNCRFEGEPPGNQTEMAQQGRETQLKQAVLVARA